MNVTRSYDNEEGSLFGEGNFLVDKDYFFILSLVGDICSEVIEVVGLSDLVPELSVYWHGFDLDTIIFT